MTGGRTSLTVDPRLGVLMGRVLAFDDDLDPLPVLRAIRVGIFWASINGRLLFLSGLSTIATQGGS